jgi:hypothetical protein
MNTTKVVINRCFGGFSLSVKAQEMLIDIGWSEEDIFDLNWRHENRSKADLVAVVEALGVEASGSYAELKVVEFPAQEYIVQDNDGVECVVRPDFLIAC